MNNRIVLKPALLGALSVILPTPEETVLMRACLSFNESPCQMWDQWQSLRKDVGNSFLGDSPSVKKIWPLVFNAVRRYSLEVDKESQTYLRSAYLKEQLRSKIFRRICRDVLLSLASEEIPTIVLKGVALAETVYGNPVLRHCHDVDLLIKDPDIGRAASLLHSIRFKNIDPKAELVKGDCKLEHESGLSLELHTALFQLPYYNALLGEMWERSQNQVIADVETKILAPADNLLHVCSHAFYESGRGSLRWVSDAWFIIDRHRDLDWDLLLDCADRSHLALPLSVTLAYLVENLNAPIPASFLNSLFAAAAKTPLIEKELALFGVRTASQDGPVRFLRKMKDWRAKVLLIQWMLFPSSTYLFLVEEVRRPWLLPLHYVYRPLRYAWHRSYCKFIGLIRRFKWRIERLFLATHFPAS